MRASCYPTVQIIELDEEKERPLVAARCSLAAKESEVESACKAVTAALREAGYESTQEKTTTPNIGWVRTVK